MNPNFIEFDEWFKNLRDEYTKRQLKRSKSLRFALLTFYCVSQQLPVNIWLEMVKTGTK